MTENHAGYYRIQRDHTVEYQVPLPADAETVSRVMALCNGELGGVLTRQPGVVRIFADTASTLVFAFTPPPVPERVEWVDPHPTTGTLSWPPVTAAYRAVVSLPCCGRAECVADAQRYIRRLVAGEGGFRRSVPVSGQGMDYL